MVRERAGTVKGSAKTKYVSVYEEGLRDAFVESCDQLIAHLEYIGTVDAKAAEAVLEAARST
jgi:hypothetical protein